MRQSLFRRFVDFAIMDSLKSGVDLSK